MKRSVSLLVSENGAIVNGRYQSPILVQWHRAEGQSRELDISFSRFV
jgi:hypothetical protein